MPILHTGRFQKLRVRLPGEENIVVPLLPRRDSTTMYHLSEDMCEYVCDICPWKEKKEVLLVQVAPAKGKSNNVVIMIMININNYFL